MKHAIYSNTDLSYLGEVDGKIVSCSTVGCENYGVPFEVADHPSVIVQCGPCQQWIIPPKEGVL